VLGAMLEFNFVTSMLKSKGDLMTFVERPIAAGLGLVVLLLWAAPVLRALRSRT
jgi:putative tricarboxylic transport membrane protein